MKKRYVIPGVLIGVAAYIASQFLSFNIGDLSIPSGSEMVSTESGPSTSKSPQPTDIQPIDTVDASKSQSAVGTLAEMQPEKLLLVDIVIDGERYSVNRVTNLVDAVPSDARQPATIEEIITMVEQADGDKSGTRVRVSRTPGAVASAEIRLMDALQKAGVSSDEIDQRSRLVE